MGAFKHVKHNAKKMSEGEGEGAWMATVNKETVKKEDKQLGYEQRNREGRK